MSKVVVITGAGAGVGRATAQQFAHAGCDIGLIGRDRDRLETAAAELRTLGVRACVAPADMADAEAVDHAADTIEAALGPIDIWVNNAMATIFAPVSDITPAEFKRATEATYLGTVHGVMTALRAMKRRDQGTIINVGSALAYRSVPLQSPYCGAKAAIKGFTDSLRSELIHDRSAIKLSMVHLPAVNTPQFDWALNKMGRRAQPVPPIYDPEVPAKAIVFAAFNHRREIWVGMPTVVAIMANRIAPGFADRYLATHGYSTQMSNQPLPADAPANLFEPVPGRRGARGRFTDRSRRGSLEMFTDRHKAAALTLLAVAGAAAITGLHQLAKKYDF
ncbi:MAG: short-chain dehydrogenase [Acidiphilium sp. 37-64-53]|uniref:SDR family oxidoreductase n=1 Tax=Acidiphilium TaxID=522 RepID=UPI000BC48460|nr:MULTISPECIES: SDR family oxidoreductase [Acidiphilium]OYW01651.1 MAG: short-chain dehydrogenase [Acidiphilium sp. 37-64-53]OZB30005.1 MAG: short-chain dehydrogenase [Acidiphilium sp. 34-64-41]HQT83669.1 SDR family oxidoreductase [Acidiphilium rubrum]